MLNLKPADDEPAAPAAAAKPGPLDVQHVRARAKTLPLAWPLTVNGKTIDKIVLRRLTSKQVQDFIGGIKDQEAEVRFPMFYDIDGNQLPDEVMDALDDDDAVMLNGEALDFLPQRWRQPTAGESSPPAAGANTGPA